jgi:DNA polymerase-1
METLYLIDASGFLFRAYFAIQGLSSSQGEATNALFGFIRSYLRLSNECSPKYIAAIFDGERSKEARLAIYKEYKAHRSQVAIDLIQQIAETQKFCTLMGLPMLACKGVEADDTIASVTMWAKANGFRVAIVTSDKDLAQLVDEHVVLINPHKEMLVVDIKKVEELYGVPPQQIKDFLSIVGDTSDNIPGISGFGPKTAVQLLKQYGSLESILAHAKEIGGKKAETLEKEKDLALLSQKLVALDVQVPFPKEKEFFSLKTAHWNDLSAFFKEKNFTSLLKIIPQGRQTSSDQEKMMYHTIVTEEELDALLDLLSTCQEICFDTETTSEYPLRAELVGIGLGSLDHGAHAYYIPMNGPLPKETIIKKLKPFFENETLSFFGHNVKYDCHILMNEGIFVKNLSFDTILASYILHAHQRRHSLDELSLELFGKKKIAISDLIGKGKKAITMAQVPLEAISTYCCEDIEYTCKLKQLLAKELKERNLEHILFDIELPLSRVLLKMERKGMYIDAAFLQALSIEMSKAITMIEEKIYNLAGEPFNINSPKQLSDILFQKLKIPPQKRGKTSLSTSAEVLELLSADYPIARSILEYRSLEKLRSTYIDALPQEVSPKTGRIHCQFNQSVAATGRLSCQNPNLQNIPVRTEEGRKIRQAFHPELHGYSFVSFDYSQVELRLLAHLSGDDYLIRAFHEGIDVHAFTAAEIFNIPLEEVTNDMRQKAKAVNFGVIYGQQAFGLSKELQIPVKDAAHFINLYFARYKKVKEFIEHTKEMARKTQRAVTLTGRERMIPEITSSNMMLRAAAERLAVNTPLQGTAADIIKIAMIQIDSWLSQEKMQSSMVLQVHDELIFEAPDSEIDRLRDGVKARMEGVFPLKVPLTVQISVGKNWKEC